MNKLMTELTALGARVQLNEHGLVDWVDLSYKNIDEESLRLIDDETARHITYLSLAGTRVSDAALSSLQRFAALEELDLGDTDISGSGFEYLCSLPLRVVNLNGCLKLARGSITRLASLHTLRRLFLDNSNLNDELIEEVGSLRSLETLRADGTSISDLGLSSLSGLSHLKWLDVKHTRITHAGMMNLFSQLPQLNRRLTL